MAGRGHPDGHRVRHVLIGGREVDVGAPLRRSPRAAQLSRQGRVVPEVYPLSPAGAGGFRTAIAALAEGNPFASSVYVYDEDEYQGMRLHVTDDGKAGFALKGDEIVSVFVHADSSYRGCGSALLAAAVDAGGRRLDCFDTVLPRIYAEEGFVPVARLAWNDEFAPDGWDYDTYARFNGGRPDVVFMTFDPEHVGGSYVAGAGERVEDYDQAVACVDAALS